MRKMNRRRKRENLTKTQIEEENSTLNREFNKATFDEGSEYEYLLDPLRNFKLDDFNDHFFSEDEVNQKEEKEVLIEKTKEKVEKKGIFKNQFMEFQL